MVKAIFSAVSARREAQEGFFEHCGVWSTPFDRYDERWMRTVVVKLLKLG